MNPGSWLRHSLLVARTERLRSRRYLDRSPVLRAAITVAVVSIAVGSGFGAYTVGVALRRGQTILPLDLVPLAVTGGFLALLVGFVQGASRLAERINTDHLLTTIPAHEIILGVVMAVASRTAIRLSLTVVSVAVGFAVGFRSPANAFTIVVAVAGLIALTAMLGVCLSFAVELLTTRSPRFRRYKNVFVVVTFVFFSLAWVAESAGLVSVDLVLDWLGAAPPAWFVQLGLLGVPGVQSETLPIVGALGLIIAGLPVLMIVATVLAERVWETEPVSAAALHRSRSLVGGGLSERLFAGHVSRPALTVARKRWLQERRVPRGLMLPGYLILLLLGVFFPILAAGEVPGISLVLLVFICAAAFGLAFGLAPIETEYSSLPMTLTTVGGDQFVRGTVLAGGAVGVPVTAIVTLLLAVGSPLGGLETLVIVFVGVVLCVCSLTLAAAIGMRVAYRDLLPAPLPFTSAIIHTEIGLAGFIKMGATLGLLGLVCLPALVVYGAAFFGGSAVAALPVSTTVVRVGALILTIVLAVAVSMVSYRRAVHRFNDYPLP